MSYPASRRQLGGRMRITRRRRRIQIGEHPIDLARTRDGVMRLATARDEILPLRDPRVRENEAYLSIVLLSRVVIRLGTMTDMDDVLEVILARSVAAIQRTDFAGWLETLG